MVDIRLSVLNPEISTGIFLPSGNGTTASVPCKVASNPDFGPDSIPPLAACGFPESGVTALPALDTITSCPGATGLSGTPPLASTGSMCHVSPDTGLWKPYLLNSPNWIALLACADCMSKARPTSCLLLPGLAALGLPYFLNRAI